MHQERSCRVSSESLSLQHNNSLKSAHDGTRVAHPPESANRIVDPGKTTQAKRPSVCSRPRKPMTRVSRSLERQRPARRQSRALRRRGASSLPLLTPSRGQRGETRRMPRPFRTIEWRQQNQRQRLRRGSPLRPRLLLPPWPREQEHTTSSR